MARYKALIVRIGLRAERNAQLGGTSHADPLVEERASTLLRHRVG